MENPGPESGFGILEKGVMMEICKCTYVIEQLCRCFKSRNFTREIQHTVCWRLTIMFNKIEKQISRKNQQNVKSVSLSATYK